MEIFVWGKLGISDFTYRNHVFICGYCHLAYHTAESDVQTQSENVLHPLKIKTFSLVGKFILLQQRLFSTLGIRIFSILLFSFALFFMDINFYTVL